MEIKDVFQYLKDNISIEIDISKDYRMYDRGDCYCVKVQIYLVNPETNQVELICSNSSSS